MTLNEVAKKVSGKQDLTRDEMGSAFREIMEGKADAGATKSFLIALGDKGETAQEIAAAALVMRQKMTRVELPYEIVLDTCGTGGGARSFNVSTVVALIAASCGVKVAKHGNRSYTSHCGSADVLERLGVKIDVAPRIAALCVKDAGIGFLFAPSYHTAMKYVAAVRKEIGRRTIFNMLGPLVNPAGANVQVVGAFDKPRAGILAEAMRDIGTRRAFVVHSLDGFDEISVSDRTFVAEVNGGAVRTFYLGPEDFGLKKISAKDVVCNSIDDNIAAVRSVLDGERSGHRDMALANASAALTVAGAARTLEEGALMARDAIDSGKTKAVLNRLVDLTNGNYK